MRWPEGQIAAASAAFPLVLAFRLALDVIKLAKAATDTKVNAYCTNFSDQKTQNML